MRLYKVKAQVVEITEIPEDRHYQVRVKHANKVGGLVERTVYFPMKVAVGDWVEVNWDQRP